MGNIGGLINSIIGGASNAAGNTGGAIFGNQAIQQQMGAAGRQQAMAQGLWATPLSKGGKRAKQGLWDLINPELQAVLSGNTQVINPELSSGMYNMLTRDLTKNYQDTRKGLEQGLVNRGMDYGNVMQKSLGKADESYRTQLGDIGTKVAYNAATANYAAQQDRYQNLINILFSLFTNSKREQQGLKQYGLDQLFDASNAYGQIGASKWKMYNDLFQDLNSGAAQSGHVGWHRRADGAVTSRAG